MPTARSDREEFVLLGDDANPLKIVERTEFTLVCEASSTV